MACIYICAEAQCAEGRVPIYSHITLRGVTLNLLPSAWVDERHHWILTKSVQFSPYIANLNTYIYDVASVWYMIPSMIYW